MIEVKSINLAAALLCEPTARLEKTSTMPGSGRPLVVFHIDIEPELQERIERELATRSLLVNIRAYLDKYHELKRLIHRERDALAG